MEEVGELENGELCCDWFNVVESEDRGDLIEWIGKDGDEIGKEEDIYGWVMIGEGILECECGKSWVGEWGNDKLFGMKGE